MIVARNVTVARELALQYQHAQKIKAVGNLAGGVAHDFNNLLTVIQGSTELQLAVLPADSEAYELAEEVLRATNRASALTRQLLAVCRLENVRPVTVDLNSAIRDFSKMLHRLVGEDVSLVLELDESIASIVFDPGELEQVLLNLVVNARDAISHGGTIRIVTAQSLYDANRSPRASPRVSLTVSDDGSGIDDETIDRIFDPFFTTKEVGQGTGLGLSTTLGIVSRSGAAIHVESELGSGSSFTVQFQVSKDEAPSNDASSGQPVPDRGRETIFVVEDDPAVLRILGRKLESCGYNIVTARDGAEALNEFGNMDVAPNLILSDVVMPVMTGPDFVAQLQASGDRTPVIFMSGYQQSLGRQRSEDLPDHVLRLQKPIPLADLAKAVRDVLDRAKIIRTVGA